jgi:RNA polymerase sigma-70 factor (sigma-E family)
MQPAEHLMDSSMGVGNDQQFRDFVIARSPDLLRSAFLLTGDRGLAEDLVQSALLRTYVAWSKVSGADDPHAYARKILFNVFSRQRRRRRVLETLADPVEVPHRPNEQVETRDQLRRALRGLGPRQRAVIVLRFFEDLSVEQVAQLWSVPGLIDTGLGCQFG